MPPCARNSERANLASLNVLLKCRELLKHHLGLTCNEVGRRESAHLIWHMHEIDTRSGFEHLAGKVRRRAIASPEVELTRFCFGQLDQFAQRSRGNGRMNQHQKRCGSDATDRRE